MSISGTKTVLRRRTHFNSCPTQAICLMLVSGIVVAHLHIVDIPPFYWMIATLCLIALSLIIRSLLAKSLLLFGAIAMTGALLTTMQEMRLQQPQKVYAYNDLSSLDRTKLKAQEFRTQLIQGMACQHLSSQEKAIISAMTLGDKNSINQDTRHAFSASGASHILAISGLHIGIIFQLFLLLSGGKKRRRLFSIPISIIAIWSYVFFIGLPSSAVRAASMISIYCFVLLTRRNSKPLGNLALTAIVMLTINPLNLFDISFQLSFAAVLSILLLYKPIYQILPIRLTRCLPIRWAWAMVAVSTAAQISTMPLICYYFGNISCYSVLSSFVAIPAATIIIYVSMLLLLTTTLLPILTFIQDLSVRLLSITISTTQQALQGIAMLPGANFDGIKISILQCGLVYIAIIAGCILIQKLLLCHQHQIHLATEIRTDRNREEYQTSPSD